MTQRSYDLMDFTGLEEEWQLRLLDTVVFRDIQYVQSRVLAFVFVAPPPLSLLYSSNECKLFCFFSKYRTCDVSSGSLPMSAVDVDYMISDTQLNCTVYCTEAF